MAGWLSSQSVPYNSQTQPDAFEGLPSRRRWPSTPEVPGPASRVRSASAASSTYSAKGSRTGRITSSSSTARRLPATHSPHRQTAAGWTTAHDIGLWRRTGQGPDYNEMKVTAAALKRRRFAFSLTSGSRTPRRSTTVGETSSRPTGSFRPRRRHSLNQRTHL